MKCCSRCLCGLGSISATLVAVAAVLSVSLPCRDWLQACAHGSDFGLCALVPGSRRLCGQACGWCIGDAFAEPPPESPWRPLERLPWNTSLAYFEEHHKQKHVPVIFEGWLKQTKTAEWDLQKLLEVCGDREVRFAERRAFTLEQILDQLGEGLLRVVVDRVTRLVWNTTFADALQESLASCTLNDLIARFEEWNTQESSPANFPSLLNYLLHPPSINDMKLEELCPNLLDDAVLPRWARHGLKSCNRGDRRFEPSVFIEAHGSRAYPAHQHGADLTHGFQVLISGAKRVVLWPYSEREKLSPVLRSITTEKHDEIYLAEGIHHRFDQFPAMARAEGWEGTLEAGDLLFVPSIGIHVFESVGTSVGLRFGNHDESSVKFGEELLRAGSSAVPERLMRILKKLEFEEPVKAADVLLTDLVVERGCA